ncbi:hypothetical protein K0T92_09615 [Paenibacillus oenotherae]|uniref:DUF5668 domain-containing protein n=1 Tax=Paenibacillus oenotherae TaxID=1435645 RepID=A0ABS7D615_9BACL|nr:hypothetical protein [Paenibacillus oenotherae]MBW7475002.1 hypothetical protein [Paenibacillus oenotherae]
MRKQWRVGTWSMGVALAGMGILLVVSHFNGTEGLDLGLFWWPLLLVVLGIEVMVYLWRSQSDQPVLRYDLFSILFIAMIGSFSILLTMVSTTGIFEEIRGVVSAREYRVEAKALHVSAAGIERIVVQGDYYWNGQLEVDPGKTGLNEVHAFGSCQYEIGRDEKPPSTVELAGSNVIGDTMYVTVKSPDRQRLLLEQRVPLCKLMIVIPGDKQVDIARTMNITLAAGASLPAGWRFVGG